jgi:hypothetical protein
MLLAWATPAAAAKPRPLRFGLNDLPLSHSNPARAMDRHIRLGSTVERVGLAWRSVQPTPESFDWTYPDRIYKEATGAGLRPVFIVSQTPAWAQTRTLVRACLFEPNDRDCQRPPAPEHLGEFASFVEAAAVRYRKLAALEVFNEPNLGNWNWQPRADPEAYAQVLRVAHDAVHRVRSDLPVISGGITAPPSPVTAGMMDPAEFLERMYAAGGRGAMDGIGLHPYPGHASPLDPGGSGVRLTRRVREIRDANGDGDLPLWVTEVGYSTRGPSGLSLARQADWLPRIVDHLLRERDVAAVVVHTLADKDIEGADGGYGLTFGDLVPKPVFAALAAVVHQVADERSASACRCSRKARRCAARHSRTRACRRARKRCRCIRRWRSCVRRGSHSRACRRARRCARCARAQAAGASCRGRSPAR